MKRVLVTVGTTPFDSLIRHVDQSAWVHDNEVECQIADGTYVPSRCKSFRFDERIEAYYQSSDIVVCHAGAGTLYRLLEEGKFIIAVPNMDRADKHQWEIARYLEIERFACVAWKLEDIDRWMRSPPELRRYSKPICTLAEDIKGYLGRIVES